MAPRAVALSVPFFFLLIAAEVLVTRRQHRRAFAFHDSIGSLSCGVGQQAIGLVTAAAMPWSMSAFTSSKSRLDRR